MKANESNWQNALKENPFPDRQFDETIKRAVRSRIGKRGGKGMKFKSVAFVCATSILIVFGLFYAPNMIGRTDNPQHLESRNSYYEGGELLLQVFPDPELKAGREYGYLFHFAKLVQKEIVGKELAIEAIHLGSNERVTALAPFIVGEPSSAEMNMERYVVRCALPIGGLWLYEVKLDGSNYASVVLEVGEPDWTPSPTFTSGSYEMRGIEGKIGFIDPGFVARKPNKYMWHAWGAPSELEGSFEVKAVKQGTQQMISVIEGLRFGGAINDADASIPSSMALPEPGVWRLLPFVGGRLMESIVVEVMPQEAQSVTTEQLKKVTPEMTFAELLEIIGESTDIGSGRTIRVYRHTGGAEIVLNYVNASETVYPDIYDTIQNIIWNE
ncbi:hypothetical protein B1748_33435 [Paenibacillus sp. MY03]|uniref:DUF4871 domain-containing protein n=1 Tax=Paenibacillus sp. MY03 TaxID=302980 RepID=UPI000B3C55C4|nr:DUF4871 domain-containing protein [Paenibacillus sp. MY03]OUS68643.1 hypothetical protein B1748_33435 [Paenibacillus sp. MY03]